MEKHDEDYNTVMLFLTVTLSECYSVQHFTNTSLQVSLGVISVGKVFNNVIHYNHKLSCSKCNIINNFLRTLHYFSRFVILCLRTQMYWRDVIKCGFTRRRHYWCRHISGPLAAHRCNTAQQYSGSWFIHQDFLCVRIFTQIFAYTQRFSRKSTWALVRGPPGLMNSFLHHVDGRVCVADLGNTWHQDALWEEGDQEQAERWSGVKWCPCLHTSGLFNSIKRNNTILSRWSQCYAWLM